MAKTIKDPAEIFAEFTADYQAIYGDDLISIILYGSAARSDYRPGKSDINFMIVLSEQGIDQLDRAFPVIRKWRKKNVAVPLFLTEIYVETSTDVFPVEYLNFQQNHFLVFGRDVVKDLVFRPEFIRLQCEREIKGKLLLLRQAFLDAAGKAERLKRVVRHSVPGLAAIFEALVRLQGSDVPMQPREIVKRTCELFDLDAGVFNRLFDIREGKISPGHAEFRELFKAYIMQMRKLAKRVDAWGE